MFEKLRKIWEARPLNEDVWNPARALRKMNAEMGQSAEDFPETENFRLFRIDTRTEAKRYPLTSIFRIAAVLVLLIGTVGAVYFLKQKAMERELRNRASNFTIEEIATKPGQQVSFSFADGTRVFLNSETHLRYRTDPSGSRDVFLRGEAYFEVHHSDYDPLVVHVNGAVIRDLGTKFDVKAWPGDPTAQVTVAQGVVSVQPLHQQKRVLVNRGEYSVFDKNGVVVPPTHTNVSQDLGWMKGRLSFDHDKFSEVIRQLRRQFGINCFVADSAMLSERLTVSFNDHEPLKRILDVIALSMGFQYRASGDSVLFVYQKEPLRIGESTLSAKGASHRRGGLEN